MTCILSTFSRLNLALLPILLLVMLTPEFLPAKSKLKSPRKKPGYISRARKIIHKKFLKRKRAKLFAKRKEYSLQKKSPQFSFQIRKNNWFSRSYRGFYPIKFEVENHGAATPLEITITFSSPHTIKQKIYFDSGEKKEFDICVPFYMGGTNRVSFSSNDWENSYRLYQGCYLTNSSKKRFFLFAGRPVDITRVENANKQIQKKGYYNGLNTFICPLEDLPVTIEPYLCCDAVFIRFNEFQSLRITQKEALMNWVAQGGLLNFIDTGRDILVDAQKLSLPHSKMLINRKKRIYLEERGYHLLGGTILIHTSPVFPGKIKEWMNRHNRFWNDLFPDTQSIYWKNSKPSVQNNLFTTPRLALLGVLTLFLILVGPVNYIFLKRKNCEIFFVLTVPALSLVINTAIFLTIFLSNGLNHKARLKKVSIVDNDTQTGIHAINRELFLSGWNNPEFSFNHKVTVNLIIPENAKKRSPYGSRTNLNYVNISREDGKLKIGSRWCNSRNISILNSLEISKTRKFIRIEQRLSKNTTNPGMIRLSNLTENRVNELYIRFPGDLYWKLRKPLQPGEMIEIEKIDLQYGGHALPFNLFPALKEYEDLLSKQNKGVYLASFENTKSTEATLMNAENINSVQTTYEMAGFFTP